MCRCVVPEMQTAAIETNDFTPRYRLSQGCGLPVDAKPAFPNPGLDLASRAVPRRSQDLLDSFSPRWLTRRGRLLRGFRAW